jgi:hypothetical protein
MEERVGVNWMEVCGGYTRDEGLVEEVLPTQIKKKFQHISLLSIQKITHKI